MLAYSSLSICLSCETVLFIFMLFDRALEPRFACEAIRHRIVRVRYTSTDMNVADLFTKPLTIAVFERLLKRAHETKRATELKGYEEVQVCIGPQTFLIHG